MAKNRVKKKHFRIVRELMEAGKPVPYFYIMRVRDYYGDFVDNRYTNVFQPWWYEQFDNWREMDLKAEHQKHFEETERLFAELSGINMDKLQELYNHVKKLKRERKPRKENPPEPIRKLRRPAIFAISIANGGNTEKLFVDGEIVFNFNGYPFFIHHQYGEWTVTCCKTGYSIYSDRRYKRAVKLAREKLERNFEKYVELVQLLGA